MKLLHENQSKKKEKQRKETLNLEKIHRVVEKKVDTTTN
jgi:hypothetical protein